MYYSPLRLAGFNSDGNNAAPDKKDILLARKKLMAELELSEDHSIVANGKELNRQDVISIFDELNNDEQLAWHLAIFKDKWLLRFLEKAEIETGQFWRENELYGEYVFLSFISPYFAEAHDALLAYSLKNITTPNSYGALRKNPQLILPADWEDSFRYANRFFIEKKNQLLVFVHRIEAPGSEVKSLVDPILGVQQVQIETDQNVKPADIQTWCSDQSLLLLNLFPDEFSELRYNLVNELNNICVACDKRAKFHTAYAALMKAELIDTEETMTALIRKNINIIYSKLPGKRTVTKSRNLEKQKPNYTYAAIVIGIVVLRFLAFLGNSSSSSNPTFNYTDVKSTTAFLNASIAKRSYYSLISSLCGHADTSQFQNAYVFTSVIYIPRPKTKGEDVYAALWTKGKFKTNSPNDILADSLKPGTIKIDNRTKQPMIVFYLKDEEYIGSAYVPAKEVYYLNYKNRQIFVDIYAGTSWSDSMQNSFINYVQSITGDAVILKGGFTKIYAATNGLDPSHQNSLLTASCGEKFPARDKIIITDSAGYGPVFKAASDYD